MSFSKSISVSKIAVTGNIGVGKTTLCKALAKAIPNSKLLLEDFDENRYLEQFYNEMANIGPNGYNRFAFPVQMDFLKQRITREARCAPRNSGVTNIIDRCLMEDKLIFAENQRRNNILSEDEYLRYEKYFEKHTQNAQKLDILIYLRADIRTLARRINRRNRDMEHNIDTTYLEQLNDLYNDFFIPEMKLDSMKQHRENETRFLEIKTLRNLIKELHDGQMINSKAKQKTLRERIRSQYEEVKVLFGLKNEKFGYMSEEELSFNREKYGFLEEEFDKLVNAKNIPENYSGIIDAVERKISQKQESATKILTYDTRGMDEDLIMHKISMDFDDLGLSLI